MDNDKTIDVGRLIDEQPLRPFHVGLVMLLFLFMVADGYDLQAMGFAAPGIVKMLHIGRAALGPVFSASLVGLLIGAPLFGWIGDRFGRRPALICGLAIFGVLSLATAFAHDQQQLLLLRFLTGIGLGGVPANSVALVAEYAPKRVRATMIVAAQIGLTFGSMLPAAASALLESAYGWRPLFLVGGIGPILIAAVGLFVLPELLKFMVAKRWPQAKIRRVAVALDPQLADDREVAFVAPPSGMAPPRGLGLKALFADGLAWITPLIWVLYITFLASNYFLHSWMPILFRDEGLTIAQTAIAAGMFDVGGVFGALVASRLLDRFGVAAIVGFFLVACPAIGLIGLLGSSVLVLGTAIFVAGFCLVGVTLTTGAVAGVIYPTEVRAYGIGWAYAFGRFASILSPLIGGVLVGMRLPISALFLVPAVPMMIGAAACFALMRLCVRRFGGARLVAG